MEAAHDMAATGLAFLQARRQAGQPGLAPGPSVRSVLPWFCSGWDHALLALGQVGLQAGGYLPGCQTAHGDDLAAAAMS